MNFGFLNNLAKTILEHVEGMRRGNATSAKVLPILQSVAQDAAAAAEQSVLGKLAGVAGVEPTMTGAAQLINGVISQNVKDPITSTLLTYIVDSKLIGSTNAVQVLSGTGAGTSPNVPVAPMANVPVAPMAPVANDAPPISQSDSQGLGGS